MSASDDERIQPALHVVLSGDADGLRAALAAGLGASEQPQPTTAGTTYPLGPGAADGSLKIHTTDAATTTAAVPRDRPDSANVTMSLVR